MRRVSKKKNVATVVEAGASNLQFCLQIIGIDLNR